MNNEQYKDKKNKENLLEIASKRIVELRNSQPLNRNYIVIHDNTLHLNLEIYKILTKNLNKLTK